MLSPHALTGRRKKRLRRFNGRRPFRLGRFQSGARHRGPLALWFRSL